jgi:hypothetical protein
MILPLKTWHDEKVEPNKVAQVPKLAKIRDLHNASFSKYGGAHLLNSMLYKNSMKSEGIV